MLVGVVSDTHNNLKNIETIISLFNEKKVDLVVHTGDIASSIALTKFANLNCDLVGVYGNNDRNELGLSETASVNNFKFQEPPFSLIINNKNVVIFHEPDCIDNYLMENHDTDVVLHGHTHRYRNEIREGVILFNPGESAGMLKGKNAIGIIDMKNLSIKRIFF
tara:strand:+ start:1138 stop:1629 length:492 start_codon:yes stop_codon:yes gene_type:complete